MLDSRRVEDLTLRFTDQDSGLRLGPGVHGIGHAGDGNGLGLVADPASALVRFCIDRRGVWLTVAEGARGVHVNGRPVQRMAMLRVGDAIYVDGVEMVLASDRAIAPLPEALRHAPADGGGDPRVVLRGVGGQYHGRSFTLERPRLIGSAADADIRIDAPAFAEHHARLELHGDRIVLRDLGSIEGSLLNGQPIRDAMLEPGDQVVFDSHHRFVVEAPSRGASPHALPQGQGEGVSPPSPSGSALAASTRRLPWLLLAALLIAGALSLLLLFGSAA
jgi:hypothetical protein